MFGSGRAILSLRQSYRDDMREVKRVTDFRYVRFHNILHDEVGVYNEDKQGNPVYNFTYVDQIYDGLLQNGVRPVVEISFMPKKLASNPNALHPFWYKQNVSPPKDYAKWDDLIRAFAKHLVERYGVGEVSQWYFEVWNEPNIDFWAGEPKQATYFELYDHTARALKSISPLLRVGGPSTAAADWVDAFLAHAVQQNVPVDFVSSHGYADDTVQNLFHNDEPVPMDQRVCRAIQKVRGQIKQSGRPSLPLFWTEWNVPGRDALRDTTFVAPAVAYDVLQCDGQVDMMSFWTFDDVFEENGPPQDPFHGGFGLIAEDGIKKPSYFGFSLLHRLGYERLANPAQNMLVTRRTDGTLVIALWNLVNANKLAGAAPVQSRLQFRNIAANATALISRADDTHGNTLAIYQRLGSPNYPTQAQVSEINREGELATPEAATLSNGMLEVIIPPNGLVLVEILR